MIRKVALILPLLLLLVFTPAKAANLTVTVHDHAVVTGPSFTLGEIAAIEGDGAGQLSGIIVGSAAAPGAQVVLTPDLIWMRLSAAGIDFAGANWIIPARVTVTTAAQLMRGSSLIEQAVSTLEQRLTAAGGEYTITPLAVPADFYVPSGTVVITVDVPYGVRYSGPTLTYSTITVDGRRAAVVPIRFEIKMYRTIVVAARAIAARQEITAADLRLERADIGRLPSGYLTDINKAVGLAARRPLISGAVLTDSVLAKPIIIKRGRPVTIVVRGGGIQVTASGQALQDGAEGQLIRVKNVSSNKLITARVLDETTVQALTYNGK